MNRTEAMNLILWTVMPLELVFENVATPQTFVELRQGKRLFLLQPQPDGRAKLVRLISSDPRDFLNPAWQPGTILPWPGPDAGDQNFP